VANTTCNRSGATFTAQFTCFTSTKVQTLTPLQSRSNCALREPNPPSGVYVRTSRSRQRLPHPALPLPFLSRSSSPRTGRPRQVMGQAGAQFSCFTSTKVQILTQLGKQPVSPYGFDGFWARAADYLQVRSLLLSLLALLVQKYQY
jgi:hypothetical protein